MNPKLAIIIPAYKPNYFKECLASLYRQTNKNFKVYIGDDCSPYNLKCIADEFVGSLNLHYHRFEENMGGKDLVRHWERCVAMSKDEEWLWLFSDDDILDSKCIEEFYNEINNSSYDVYHYNVNVIDDKNRIIKKIIFPTIISSQELILQKLRGRYNSYVVEYIFSRRVYNQKEGFQTFDLAWGADDATWAKFGLEKGIKTINGANVLWRKSPFNISPNYSNYNIVVRKLNSNMEFSKWVIELFSRVNFFYKIKLRISLTTWFCVNLLKSESVLSADESNQYCEKICKITANSFIVPLMKVYIYLKKKKQRL